MNLWKICLGVIAGVIVGELVGAVLEHYFGRTVRMIASAIVLLALIAMAVLHS